MYRRQPDTPESRRALLETLDRPGATVRVYERDDGPLIDGLVRDGSWSAWSGARRTRSRRSAGPTAPH